MTSMYDMNDAEPQRSGEPIPDGSFAKMTMALRPGGIDGQSEIDKGLLKASNTVGSDVLNLDCEFTIVEGPHAKRKFWQTLTASGGKVDEKGVSLGWKITKSTIRAMIDSALGLNPKDMSEAAKQKRVLRGLADLNGITFVAKIRVEPSDDSRYGDANKLARVILPTEKEWQAVMQGQDVPPSPTPAKARGKAPAQQQPAWNTQGTQPAAQPAWNTGQQPASAAPASSSTAAAPQAPTQPAPAPQAPAQPAPQAQPAAQGPAWLNG
jgi:hypothetical protein